MECRSFSSYFTSLFPAGKFDRRVRICYTGIVRLGGAYGVNGPPLVVYGNMRQWSAGHFRATLQAYFLPVSLIGVLGYAIQGLLGWVEHMVLTALHLWCMEICGNGVPVIFE